MVLLPCILVSGSPVCIKNNANIFQGYYTIASALLRDPETVRSKCSPLHQREKAGLTYLLDTVYFPLWVQANASGSSATKYRSMDSP